MELCEIESPEWNWHTDLGWLSHQTQGTGLLMVHCQYSDLSCMCGPIPQLSPNCVPTIVSSLIYSTQRCGMVAGILYPVYALATVGCHPMPSSGFVPYIRKSSWGGCAYLLWRLLRLLRCNANRLFQPMSSLASKWYGDSVLSQVSLKLCPTRNKHFLFYQDCFSCSIHVSLPLLPVDGSVWKQNYRQH